MTLKSFLKVNIEARFSVIRSSEHGYETYKIDYTSLGNDRHFEKVHYIDCAAKLPKEVLMEKVKFVSINRATGALDINVE